MSTDTQQPAHVLPVRESDIIESKENTHEGVLTLVSGSASGGRGGRIPEKKVKKLEAFQFFANIEQKQ